MEYLVTLLDADFLGKAAWIWLLFFGIVTALLAFDLGVLHKGDQEIGVGESLLLSAGYISFALICLVPGCGGTWARKVAWRTSPGS